ASFGASGSDGCPVCRLRRAEWMRSRAARTPRSQMLSAPVAAAGRDGSAEERVRAGRDSVGVIRFDRMLYETLQQNRTGFQVVVRVVQIFRVGGRRLALFGFHQLALFSWIGTRLWRGGRYGCNRAAG